MPKKAITYIATGLGVLLTIGSSANAVRVDRVVGATTSGGSYLVKRFSVPTGAVVVGAEVVTNDLRTTFPRILLLEGSGKKLGNLRIAAELRNVHPIGRHVLQVAFPALNIEEPRDLYVAVGLPTSNGVRSVGDGPGLGALLPHGSADCYLASADDGSLQPIDVDLCVRLLFRGAVVKAEAAEIPSIPAVMSIEARPNPFNPTTTIAFDVPSPAAVELKIFSVSGRAIRSLVDEELAAGSYSRDWDGRDAMGRLVSGGVYIAKLQVKDATASRRLILIK